MQIFLGLALGGTECILLGLSAFSWASCLMTDTLPSADLCTIHSWWTGLSVGRWPLAHWPVVLWMSWYTLSMRFPFCEPREICHFYCELPSVLCLSYDDTSIYETGVLLSITILLLIPFSVILASSHSSWSPSTKWLLLKARKKHSLPACLTWQWSAYIMVPSFLCICGQFLPIFQAKIK